MTPNFTVRKNAERERIMDLIREHQTEFSSAPSDSDCFDFALKAAERELSGKPKPRSPRKKW
jgi:hypothetical protein